MEIGLESGFAGATVVASTAFAAKARMFRYHHLPTDSPVSIPSDMTAFGCLILIEREIGPAYRAEVSEALVKAGCRCAMAWGLNCVLWDDSVDVAFLDLHGGGDCPDGRYVLTTWHDGESLGDVIEFARPWQLDCSSQDLLGLDFRSQERSRAIELFFRSV